MERLHTSPGLRYHAIAAEIRARLKKGTLRQGDALPSQAALAREFHTSVMTVRQAIKLLEREGLIVARHGVGSFVTGMREDSLGFELRGFHQVLDRNDIEILTTVVDRVVRGKNARAADALGVEEDELSALVRLRSLDGLPLIYQISYVPYDYSTVIESYCAGQSLYEVLNARLGTVISHAEERLSVAVIHGEGAKALEVDPEQRVSFAAGE